MKIKEIKVFKSKGLVFAQFWSKFKNSTSGWSKTTRPLFQIYFYTELFKYLLTFLRKTWRAGQASLKFCVLSNQVVLRKTLENKNFACPALLWANISQIFFSHLEIQKYLLPFFPRVWSTGPLTLSHPSASLSKFKLILVLLRWGFNSYPNIWKKVKLPKYVHPNISIWNNLNSRKWGPRYSFLNFPNP